MSKKTARQKAQQIIDEERIFLLSDSGRYGYYIVRGENDLYDVTYDTVKKLWSCTCKNIRDNDCSHIIAAKKTKEWQDFLRK